LVIKTFSTKNDIKLFLIMMEDEKKSFFHAPVYLWPFKKCYEIKEMKNLHYKVNTDCVIYILMS